MTYDRVPCGHCKGTGRVELPQHFVVVLNQLAEWQSTAAVAQAIGVGPRKVVGRLGILFGWQLVERRKNGCGFEWRRR